MPPASERKQFICEIRELLRQQGIITRKRIDDISVYIEAELSALLVQFEKLEAKYPISPATKKVASGCDSVGSNRFNLNYSDFQDTVPLPYEMLTPAAP